MKRAALALGLAACGSEATPDDGPDAAATFATAEVTARGETDSSTGDPDDPAIWLDADDLAASRIIGTDKAHGLYVYDLSGALLQDLPDGKMNSVDLRTVTLGDRARTLVTAGNRTDDSIAMYELDASGMLARVEPADGLPAGIVIYGTCMGVDPATGDAWLFLDDKDGVVIQWRLGEDAAGAITATEVRRFDVGGQVENCVVDDALGWLYVGEEDVGVWRYGARADAGDERRQVGAAGDGALVADVEGLAIYEQPDGAGFLLVSSQGDDAYAIYERGGDQAYVGRFRIIAGALDSASESDGIAVTSTALPGYSGGLFVAHDTADAGFTGNFKLVAWDDVLSALP